MKSSRRPAGSISLGLLLARLPMGAFFLIAGYQKVFKIGVENFVAFASQSPRIPHWAPPGALHTYLHAVPYLEMSVGALLVLGLLARLGGLVGAVMVSSFIIGATGIYAEGLPFTPNFIYLGLLLLFVFAGPGMISLDGLMFGPPKERPKPPAEGEHD